MKLLITGDIHGDYQSLLYVINRHKDIDYHLCCGDISLSENQIFGLNMIAVKGNNDYSLNLPFSRVLNLDGHVIYLTHGHLESVKQTLVLLQSKARQNNADIVIYGHTHEASIFESDGILYINPGSLGYENSYCIYEKGKGRLMKL